MTKTIDRRKDVDVKIQTACEKFTERMFDNFEVLDDNLKHLQSQQFNYYNNIKQELDKINSVQSELQNSTKSKINDIENLCENFLIKSSSLEEIFLNSVKQLSDEHQSALLRILAELKEKEQKFQCEIKDNVSILQVYSEQQKSSLKSMRERLIEKFNFNNKDLQKHTNQINTTIEVIKFKSLESLQELQEITNILSEERSLMEEEQKLREECERNIKALQQKRFKCTDNASGKVENINKCQQDIITTVHKSIDGHNKFLSDQTPEFAKNSSLVEELTGQVELSIAKSVTKCTNINTQLDNMLKETLNQAEQISPRESKYLIDIINIMQENENEVKRIRLENCAKLEKNTEDILLSIDNYGKSIRDHVCNLDNTNSSLQQSIEEYSEVFGKQLNNCDHDIDSFRRSELKTYKATGDTPSKKVFTYPKILAETSPHVRIVKRFRQANDSSDLDTTVPIDEESDGDIESGVCKILDSSDADIDAVLNITP